MIYYFDKKTSTYKKLELKWIYPLIAVFFMLLLMMSFSKPKVLYKDRFIKKNILVEKVNERFSEENLELYIRKCGIKFPHIVMAQAKLESFYFKSNIFNKANNLFGMKVAKSRPTTALKEYSGHAYYDNWMMSVQDYALFQSAFLRKIRTEEDYYAYLGKNYAGDPSYVAKLKQIVNK